jgi:hypothetical protein
MLIFAGMAFFGTAAKAKVLLQDSITDAYLTEAGWTSKPFTIPEGTHVCELTVRNGSIDNTWAAMGLGSQLSRWIERRLIEAFISVQLGVAIAGGSSSPAGATISACT